MANVGTLKFFLISACSPTKVPFLIGSAAHAGARLRKPCSLVAGASLASSTCVIAHADKVARIARKLRDRTPGAPLSLRKKAVSHQVPKRHDPKYDDDKIDVRDLDRILEIDVERRTCVAESGVTFVDLVAATLAHGLVPIVVPELQTITIGGAVAGCSIESTSFRYGGFHDTCLEYEVVTARGEVLTCRPDGENALLFQMMHGTFGTLGILTKLRFRLMEAKPFVHVVYEKHDSLRAYEASIWDHYRRRDVDFMDGIIHSPNEWVLSLGRFADAAPYTHRYDWTRVYWRSTARRGEDYLRTPQYFYRYDHGVTNVHPKSFMGRLLFGKLMGSTQVLRAASVLHALLPDENPGVTLDVFVPMSKLEAFFDWYRRRVDFFPLWCVPYKRVRSYEWLSDEFFRRTRDELFADIAIYGMKPRGDRNYYKEIEDELLEIGGLKTLISHNYFSEGDFWKIWNKKTYAEVKARTDPENVFRDLYAKTCQQRL